MLARSLLLVCALVVAGGCAHSAPSPLLRATMLMDKGQTEPASALLRGYLKEHPNALAERRLLVRVEAARGQLGAAQAEVEVLEKQLGPHSPIPLVELGHALEMAHRYDEALAAYDQAAEVAPRDALGPLTGGLRAARWGELEWAEPRLTEAVRRGPKDPAAWHALGVVRLSLGDLTGAEQAYRSGLLADPAALENRVGLATLAISRGDLASALVQYDAIAARRPNLADAQLGRSFALMGLGRFAEAHRALDEAARLGGDPKVVAAQRSALARRTSPHPAPPPKASPEPNQN
ncbi:MAG TPA: tetratricopeptide repeat protein [Polyangiaceae bacterium]|nr:tetratricopeptide repeat protein [Polyangiaceae bacterium]